MRLSSKIKWIIIILLFVVFLGLVTWGLYSIASNLFGGTGGDSNEVEASSSIDDTELLSAAEAKFTVDGPVVANQDHRSYVITVTPTEVEMKVYSRYNQLVTESKRYSNNQEAFDVFMAALSRYDIQAIKRSTDNDFTVMDRGVCATGKRYILEVDSSLLRWSTSCSNSQGNAGFKMSSVRALFQEQVPDYYDLVRGTGL